MSRYLSLKGGHTVTVSLLSLVLLVTVTAVSLVFPRLLTCLSVCLRLCEATPTVSPGC